MWMWRHKKVRREAILDCNQAVLDNPKALGHVDHHVLYASSVEYNEIRYLPNTDPVGSAKAKRSGRVGRDKIY
jgi:hypothetical protein